MDILKYNISSLSSSLRGEAMSKRMICEQCVFCLYPEMRFLAVNTPATAESLDRVIGESMRAEFAEYLSSYSSKALVTEIGGRALVVLPTLYPASSLGVALRFDMSGGELIRLAEACGFSELFEASKKTKISPVRLSNKIRGEIEDLERFCKELKQCFFDFDRFPLCLDAEERLELIVRQCEALALFVGCPITLEVKEDEMLPDSLELTDLPLMSAFLLTVLIMARQKSEQRSASLTLEPTASSVIASVKIESGREIGAEYGLMKWKNIAYDKNMLYDIFADGEQVRIRFDPCRAEWSLLGIKQYFSPADEFDQSSAPSSKLP